MARTAPRDDGEPVSLDDLFSRAEQVAPPDRGVQDTMPLFLDALSVADGPKPPPAQTDEPTTVLPPVPPPPAADAGKTMETAPAEDRKRPKVGLWAACALLPLGAVGALAYGLHDTEGSASAVQPVPAQGPPPAQALPPENPDPAVTATLPANPAPKADPPSRARHRQAVTTTEQNTPPPPSSSPAPDPGAQMRDVLSSIQREWESRMHQRPPQRPNG
jgi:hypothetical protein